MTTATAMTAATVLRGFEDFDSYGSGHGYGYSYGDGSGKGYGHGKAATSGKE